MKFNIILLNKAPLHLAVENNNIEITQLLLSKDTIDINSVYIFNSCY